MVMLTPVAYPWPGGVGRYNKIVAMPVIGPLLAYTITLPLGMLLIDAGVRGVFLPQPVPDGYVENTATSLLLRPREFLANAHDLVTLKAEVAEQAPRYAAIKAPITIITSDGSDKTVSTNIHSRPLAATASHAKLIVLPGLGHMVQNAVPDLVISEIEAMLSGMAQNTAAAAH
jgi:pimeloyl-ACP methyl ester carboxylesterase